MKKVFCLVLFFVKLNAQMVKVTYEFTQNKNNPFSGMIHTEQLTLTQEKSMTTRIDSKPMRKFEASEITEKNGIVYERISDNNIRMIDKNLNFFYYKDYINDSLLSSQKIGKVEYVIGEKLSQLEWSMIEKDTVFLEQGCKIATSFHRGHTWTAFFSDKYASQGGPWKLDGLPGLILYAVTEDLNYEFKATAIKTIGKSEGVVQNPFLGKITVTWDEFSKLMRNYFKKKIAYMKSKEESPDGNESVTVKINSAIESYGFDILK